MLVRKTTCTPSGSNNFRYRFNVAERGIFRISDIPSKIEETVENPLEPEMSQNPFYLTA